VTFAFCKVLSCLLLPRDTVDKNTVWNLRSRIYFRSNQHEKLLVTYLSNELPLFCYIAPLFLADVTAFLSRCSYFGETLFLQAGVITLCFVPRIVLTNLNNYMITFFLI